MFTAFRSRSSYRSVMSATNGEKSEASVTTLPKQKSIAKLKSYAKQTQVFTIDDSSDGSGDESTHSDSDNIEIIACISNSKSVRNRSERQSGDNAKNEKNAKVCKNGCDLLKHRLRAYNELTSADFYGNIRAHIQMIGLECADRVRVNAYREAILQNKHLFQNKVVLNIGCGIGLLAMTAAMAGAHTVIAVDSKHVIHLTAAVIEANRNRFMNCNMIVMSGKLSDISLPDGIEKVDIIVSDWVNQMLFLKSSLCDFIYARDKWLKKDGLVFPDYGKLSLLGAHDNIHNCVSRKLKNSKSSYLRHVEWWENVYSFDMTYIRNRVITQPSHSAVDHKRVVTNEATLKCFDFYNITVNDINFSTDFELEAIKDSRFQMFVVYFEVSFIKNLIIPIMFTTKPSALPHSSLTPTVLYIDKENELLMFKRDKLFGNFNFLLSNDLKLVSCEVSLSLHNKFHTTGTEKNFFYRSE